MICEAIAKGFWAVAEIFGYARDRSKLNNSEEMQKAQAAQKELDQDDKDATDIKNQNEKAAETGIS